MDELTIDDKKYVSSKRAAQITGYAKDYIGQLCREGYVEARRVGRSWYVLEAAIKDHRFGNEPRKEEKEVAVTVPSTDFTIVRKEETKHEPIAPSAPRYEAMETPSINLLRKEEPKEEMLHAPSEGLQGASQDFHAAWQTWFDAFHTPGEAAEAPQPLMSSEAPMLELPAGTEPLAMGKEEISVAIHHLAPDEAPDFAPMPLPAPEVRAQDTHRPYHPPVKPQRPMRLPRIALSAVCILVCAGAATLAVFGSGYLDSSLVSVERAYSLSGISVVNK